MDNLRRNEISQCVFEEIGLGGLEGVLFKGSTLARMNVFVTILE